MKSVTTKKARWMIMLGLMIASSSFAQDTTALTGTVTLDQCIAIAIKNNLQVNQTSFQSQQSKVYLMEARGNFLPNISTNINHYLSEGRVINTADNSYATKSSTGASWGLSLGVTLWNGGAIRNNALSYKYSEEASRMDLQQQEDNISINVILAYLQVLSNEEQLSAAMSQVEAVKQQVQKSSDLNDAGALSNPADLSNLKGQLASAELSVVNYRRAIENAKITLLQYLNVPYSGNFDLQKIDASVTPAAYGASADDIYFQALQNLPLVRSGYLKTLSAEKNLKAAKGQMWPQLSFGSSAGSNYSSLATEPVAPYGKIPYFTQLGNNFGSSFSIGLNIPILNGFRNKGAVQLAKISLNQAKFNENTNKTALQQNIKQAVVNVNSGYDSYQKIEEQVKDFTEAARVAQVRFNEGVTTVVDYIVAKSSADQATLNLIATKYDYVLRTKILDYYQGKLKFQ
jgi:outer membrane protein